MKQFIITKVNERRDWYKCTYQHSEGHPLHIGFGMFPSIALSNCEEDMGERWKEYDLISPPEGQ